MEILSEIRIFWKDINNVSEHVSKMDYPFDKMKQELRREC